MGSYTPIEVAIALSLYNLNESAFVRAQKVYDYFKGNCMEVSEIVEILVTSPTSIVTELPYPSAVVYVQHALERYGDEAAERVHAKACVHQQV